MINAVELQDSIIMQFEDLSQLESVIKLTKDVCLNKELFSQYYNLTKSEQLLLSEERNHYINMLTIALDKILKLKELLIFIEKSLCDYKRTPTIAADK